MIPHHLALAPWQPYRQVVWQAIAQVEARREEHCYSPLPGDTHDTLFPEVNRRRRQRFEHRLTMKHTGQARIDATLRRHKRRRYQVRLAQAEIELAFITPGELDRWVRRSQQQGLAEDDLCGLVLVWTVRFPCLAELDSYLWSAMPFW
ncbi:plasmid SOS inhibition protein A [Serratia marcescens]|uniref:plasmid SOS inhibition protein A n=1 Tax=Serratia marcescens TaxID=615 RepID=UPI003ED8947E